MSVWITIRKWIDDSTSTLDLAKADADNVLPLDNTTEFTPDSDYEPATKKYVDDNAGGAPEGTAVLSTGETGGTKFLREDGDGTCSWQDAGGGHTQNTDTNLGTLTAKLSPVIDDLMVMRNSQDSDNLITITANQLQGLLKSVYDLTYLIQNFGSLGDIGENLPDGYFVVSFEDTAYKLSYSDLLAQIQNDLGL